MSAKLIKYTDEFKTSRPIFSLKISDSGNTCNTGKINDNVYRPEPIEGDILSMLVCKCYEESFSSTNGIYQINKDKITEKAMAYIRNEVPKFLDKNLPMKSPRQSKLYRWAYRNLPRFPEFNDGLILLYTYMHTYCTINLTIPHEHQKHLDNILAILEAMRKRYDDN